MAHANQEEFTRQNHKEVSGGFTIIEVILFLALSGLFLLIAFAGIGNRTANIQFSDSMRSLHNFLTSEQSKVRNGVNSSLEVPASCGSPGTAVGTGGECVLLGRVVNFNEPVDASSTESDLIINTLYAEKLSASALAVNSSDIATIAGASPRKSSALNRYDINWGVEFDLSSSVADGIDGNIDKIGWLRSLESNRIIPIVFSSIVRDIDDVNFATSPLVTAGSTVNARLCFRDSNNEDRVASISMDSASIMTLTFDDEECI